MTATPTPARVSVIGEWAVRDLPNGDQVRARLIHDLDPAEPERDGTGVLLVRERDGYGGGDLDEHDALAEVLERTEGHGGHTIVECHEDMALDEFYPERWMSGRAKCDRETFVRRYLRAFHDVKDAFLFRHRGYSQSDWADIWVIVTHTYNGMVTADELGRLVVETWSDWAKGDAYGVESEGRTLASAMVSDGDEGWVAEDMCWGYYGDDGGRDGLAEALGVPWSAIEFAPGDVIVC